MAEDFSLAVTPKEQWTLEEMVQQQLSNFRTQWVNAIQAFERVTKGKVRVYVCACLCVFMNVCVYLSVCMYVDIACAFV